MAACRYFTQGTCKYGDSCHFVHEHSSTTLPRLEPLHIENEATSTSICSVFIKGRCSKGDQCRFSHQTASQDAFVKQPIPMAEPRPNILCKFLYLPGGCQNSSCPFYHPGHNEPNQEAGPSKPKLSSQISSSSAMPLDSRVQIPCRFMTHPNGCKNNSCPFLHDKQSSESKDHEDTDNTEDEHEDEDQGIDDDFTRTILGATAQFGDFGQILKISFPSDYSLACITGLESGTTPKNIVAILEDVGFNIPLEAVRIRPYSTTSAPTATVRVEDRSFAMKLGNKLSIQYPNLQAVPMALDTNQTNCRKVHISWHKSSRSVWINFGSGDIANRVAQKFNNGKYKCLGQVVKSSVAKRGHSFGHNAVAWTITLSDVAANATTKDITHAIWAPQDTPRHVEMGPVSYDAADADVSVVVRARLEEHGPLENFHLSHRSKGKRVKATAWFQSELDSTSACELNAKPLGILKGGKLTVTLVQAAKLKVPSSVYVVLKGQIDKEIPSWRDQHLVFRVYPDPHGQFSTLKIEGPSAKDVANAYKTLNIILAGVVVRHEGLDLWSTTLNGNGLAYQKLLEMARSSGVVITRDRTRRQLRLYAPPEKLDHALQTIIDKFRKDFPSGFEIELNPDQISWTMHGGFKQIEQSLGKGVVTFNIVSRKVVITGSRQQFETALLIMKDGQNTETDSKILPGSGTECPICLSEPDMPMHTSCGHVYCLECFEDSCITAASSSMSGFKVQCHGDEGECSSVFSLTELKEHVSSSIFEAVLKSSFEDYVKRHPNEFHYCPTPECGHIYRCSPVSLLSVPSYTCSNCFEPICTSCHARHGGHTCAEYKDIASGGLEALAKLKRELNIKDCPKCKTPMEKTEGCNHMTCGGCKAHICWVCMAVFEQSDPCYGHMNSVHGGIGLEVQF